MRYLLPVACWVIASLALLALYSPRGQAALGIGEEGISAAIFLLVVALVIWRRKKLKSLARKHDFFERLLRIKKVKLFAAGIGLIFLSLVWLITGIAFSSSVYAIEIPFVLLLFAGMTVSIGTMFIGVLDVILRR